MNNEKNKPTCLYAETTFRQVIRDLEDQSESKHLAQRALDMFEHNAKYYYTISKDQGATWIHYIAATEMEGYQAGQMLTNRDVEIFTRVPASPNFSPIKITEGELPPGVAHLEEIDRAAAPRNRFCLNTRDGEEIIALRAKLNQTTNLTKQSHQHLGSVSLDYGKTWSHYFTTQTRYSDRTNKEKNLQSIVKVPASATFKPKDVEGRLIPTEIADYISAEQKKQAEQKTQPSSFLQRFKAKKAAEREEGLEQ